MASLPAAEDEYDYVEKPSGDLYCPVTFELNRSPLLTTCCGHTLSETAVIRLQDEGQPCPVCRKSPLKVVTDDFVKLCVDELKVRCPNKSLGCEWVGELGSLDKHLDETCALQVIKCEFSYAGCEFECERQHMQAHLEENVRVHLNKVSRALQRRTQQQQSINEQQQSVIEQQQRQIVALMSALTRVALDVRKPIFPVFVPPPDMVMTDFERRKKTSDWWYSPPFYSHIGGYKMCLRVYANGHGDGERTHLSVFVHLMRGEYDDRLKWPFRGYITIQLLNQNREEENCEMILAFEEGDDDMYAGRVEGKEIGPGLGYDHFIANTKLNTEKRRFIKDDCLRVRISQVTLESF